MAEWRIYRRDQTLARLGLLPFRRATINLRWIAASKAIIVAHHDDADPVLAGDGLILTRDGTTILSGQVVEKARDRTIGDDEITLTVEDDLGRLAGRLIYPDPTLAADDDSQPARDIRTGPAEDVITGYVAANAGTQARTERQLPGLTVATSQSRGSSVTGRGRWHQLIDYAATLAERGDLGFRAVQKLGETPAITFEAVIPQDRYEARLDLDGAGGTGAVREFSYKLVLPEATVGIAGGRGELEQRLVRELVSDTITPSWSDLASTWDQLGSTWATVAPSTPQQRRGRFELWLDQNNAGDDADLQSQIDELDDALTDALRERALQADLDLKTVDTPGAAWRTHYELGDRVRVRIGGEWMWRQVRGLTVEVGAAGETVEPRLGDAASGQVLRLLERLGEVERQVAERGRA